MDEILKAIFEFIFYNTGKFVAIFLFPKINIEKSIKPKEQPFKEMKFVYKKRGASYFYETTVTLIGFMFWLIVSGLLITINIV